MEETIPSVFDEIEQERSIEYATTGQRFLNYIVDLIVGYVLGIALVIILCLFIPGLAAYINENNENPGMGLLDRLFSLVFISLTYFVMEWLLKGKTLGKLITGTRAVKEDGVSRITWKDAALRSLCRMVPFDPLSALSGHPWHDKWTHTNVVKERKRFS